MLFGILKGICIQMENENTELVYLLVLLILGEQTLTTMEESMWCSFMH